MPRWPLHPPPNHGEALSSWLARTAGRYGLTVRDLLARNLDPPNLPSDTLPRHPDAATAALDWNPPPALLATLADHTGIPLGELQCLTIAGWVPWLLDDIEPSTDPSGFTTYAQ